MYTVKYDDMGSSWMWSITLPTGKQVSTDLPKVVNNFYDFIKVDIFTGDSDPVYWAVSAARVHPDFGPRWAERFSIAMLAYYHTGTALAAASLDGSQFWGYLEDIYDDAPRGSERRHFRGEAGKASLRSMRSLSLEPALWFAQFGETYAEVKRTCETRLVQFGPYFQLKVCDYMDRCLGYPIRSYAGLERNLPADPAKALKLMGEDFNLLCKEVAARGIVAAPDFSRLAGPAEVETSLCGWKTTKLRGNWFGADILDKREMLHMVKGPEAAAFEDLLPPVLRKDMFTCVL